MSSRGHIPPGLGGRSVQAPGMMRHGPLPAGHRLLDPLPLPDALENKIAAQAGEIEQLAGDNHRLAATHVALREDLLAAQKEVERLQAHIRSIQTESDIQIRVLLDKIGKMESDIRADENVKKDLKQAHIEAQSLVKNSQELTIQIEEASRELKKVRADVRSLPDLHAELENLRNEHKRLRATFEYQKGLNIGKVEQLVRMEQNLIGMAREVERLQSEILNAETRAHAPNDYGGGYAGAAPSYPAAFHGDGGYVDAYGRPLVQMGVRHEGTGGVAAASNAAAGVRGRITGPYDPSLAHA